MKVLKFGGTSVGSPERIREVARLISNRGRNIVVLSAMSGTTNSLLGISAAALAGDTRKALELVDQLEARYVDVVRDLYSTDEVREKVGAILLPFFAEIRRLASTPDPDRTEKEIVAFGELISTNLMHQYLLSQGAKADLLPALGFMRTDEHQEPDLPYIKVRLEEMLAEEPDAHIYVTQGFICRNAKGEVDNLKRGGSDYSASLIGAAIGADEIEIWTDIDGMHNNDPRFVEGTTPVRNLHFAEAAELAYFGAKILHPTCILPAKEANIPVRLLNTMEPSAPGTLIDNNLRHGEIKAVAAKDGITAIKIKSGRMLLAYGFLKSVFDIFNKYETPIDMIVTSEVGVSLTVDCAERLPEIIAELKEYGEVTVDSDMVIICVVGDLEWQNRGFEAKALQALSDVPVRMISYGGSNFNISFLVRQEDKTRALQLLSQHLFA